MKYSSWKKLLDFHLMLLSSDDIQITLGKCGTSDPQLGQNCMATEGSPLFKMCYVC